MGNAALAFVHEQLDRLPADRIPVAIPERGEWWRYTDKHMTAGYPLVSWNANDYMNVIGVDLDVGWKGLANPDRYSQAVERCHDALVRPNIVMMGDNGRAHAAYWMRTPRYIGDAAPKGTVDFVRDITKRVRVHLGGDPQYVNRWIKNPFSEQWTSHLICPTPYEWGELAELPRVYDLVANGSLDEAAAQAQGRNAHIFYLTRHSAYQNWSRRFDSDWPGLVLGWAMEWNSHHYGDRQLPPREVARIAKSVAKWVRDKYTPKISNRPFRPYRYQRTTFILEFTPDQNQHERQRLGALYVAENKRSRTETAIRDARLRLGSTATQREVVALTGLCERTVRTYWPQTSIVA